MPQLNWIAAASIATWLVVVALRRRPDAKEFVDPLLVVALVLLVIVGVQAANPRAVYLENEFRWWLLELPFAEWLPSGIRTGWAQAGTLRWLGTGIACLLAYVSVRWVAASARARNLLLRLLVANGVAWACFGVVQKLSGTRLMYCYWLPDLEYFFASFAYKNHAATFLGMQLPLIAAISATDARDRAGWHFLCLVLATLVAAGLLLTGTMLGLAVVGVAVLILALVFGRRLVLERLGRGPWVFAGVVATLAAAALWLAKPEVERRVDEWTSGDARLSFEMRLTAMQAAWRMHRDRPFLGWGGGGFQYEFPPYQHAEPILVRNRHLSLAWEHVHNDWLQTLVELGWFGFACVAFGMAIIAKRTITLTVAGNWQRALPGFAVGFTALVAIVDFPAGNFAILIFCATCAGLCREPRIAGGIGSSQAQAQQSAP
ncbi:MAG: O-antigen ligase family protein [Opitutaceae bacterium]|nr:O-antigen ligase family protein [Opitutaceae bacterium]